MRGAVRRYHQRRHASPGTLVHHYLKIRQQQQQQQQQYLFRQTAGKPEGQKPI